MQEEIEKEFALYQEALKMKELGFDEPCFGIYRNYFMDKTYVLDLELDLNTTFEDNSNRYLDGGECSAPTYSQCFKWFEENHQMYVDRQTDTSVNEILDFTYRIKSWKFPPITIEFDNPYDCFDRQKSQLACLRKLIQIAKEQKQ